ncbi:efflux RND transporter periplasmic adaptor subunit [Hymenobacter volaticus]|uniref:Efflux RND transporter periplasmic adaptor subunit n=1 Tax=Hymenobacter volaticus TaxID=2932254 RepID=A0ABY4G3V7_9BACT|nr:efflux RND transporter periplasmic adaptor subunit [Hymenobacter volaticus]UOQ65456.1 efflux RND transporter periplasmic adaptor subunit [Hymenobacter volaticus]
MKTKTLFLLSILGVILATGAILTQGCPRIVTEGKELTSSPVTGPLRHLPAATTGRVWEVYVQSGSQVKRGQVLAKLLVPLHTVGQQQAEKELRQAKKQYDQLLSAVPNQVSAQALEQARQQLVAAQQKAASAPKQVTFVFIQAPANGVVARVPAPAGTYVSDSSTVISLGSASISSFEVADN